MAAKVVLTASETRAHTDLEHLVVFERVGAEDDPFGEAASAGSGAAVVLQRDVFTTAGAESVRRPWEQTITKTFKVTVKVM